jgi:1-pyrroline-5-carboxylate dehydrogenase
VLKGATDTPWAGRLLADCLRDAGLPRGVFNYLLGSGREVGDALTGHAGVDGITFTGSYDVGMGIYRRCANGQWPTPCIAEMGGKNAHAGQPPTPTSSAPRSASCDQVSAWAGRSARRCHGSTVEAPVADELIASSRTRSARSASATRRAPRTGSAGDQRGRAQKFLRFSQQLAQGGATMLAGGRALEDGDVRAGFYCAPTLAEAPLEHAAVAARRCSCRS